MRKADLILQDETLAHQIDLFRFTAGERKRVFALFLEMQKELKAKLQNGFTPHERARITRLLKESREIIRGYYTDMRGNFDFVELARSEAEASAKAMAVIGLEATLPSEAALKSIVSDTLIEGAPSSAWWAKQSADLQFRFASQVRQGMVQGETLQQVIIRVAGSKKLGTPGIMEVSRRNASALVHTSIQTVANDAQMATYKANSDVIKGVRHLSTLDDHTSAVCIARSGAEWDLSGIPIKGSFPFQRPPLHFNCRSLLAPITKTYKDIGVDIKEPAPGTRASDLGQIQADTSFESFLDRHTQEYQDNLLGKGKAQMWREGKITLTQLVDGTGRELTLAQLKELAH